MASIRKPTTNAGYQRVVNSKGKILVMDDDVNIRFVVKLALENRGYNVTVVKDGVEAIDRFKTAKSSGRGFNLIILDIQNDLGMGGQETNNRLLEIDPDVKTIVFSGRLNNPLMKYPESYGFAACLPKPYTNSELCDVVGSVLNLVGEKFSYDKKQEMSVI